MDFWATMLVVAKRWYVVLPAFLLALSGAFGIYTSVPTRYESRAVILLNTPPTGGTLYADGFKPDATNPLLNSGNGVDLAGSVLIQAMRTPEFAAQAGVPGDGSVTFTVNNGSDNPELLITGPFVFVTAEGPAPAAAEAIVQRAVTAARQELQVRQAALLAPVSTYVAFTTVVPPSPAVPMRGDRLRAAGSALALGLIFTLAATFACDNVLTARARRKASAGATARSSEPPQPVAPVGPPRGPDPRTAAGVDAGRPLRASQPAGLG